MSNSRNTGFLTNVIKVDATGNVSFVSGSTTLATISTSGQMSGSLPALSSSYALSASYVTNAETLDGLDSTVFTLTSSFNTLSSSLSTTSGSFNTRVTALEVTGSALSSSILSVSASSYLTSGSLSSASGSFNTRISTVESKYATTGSNTFIGTQIISGSILQSGSFTSTGTLTAQTLVVQTITSSVVYSSGSNIFGNSLGNTQTFTGSVLVTGSLALVGNTCFGGAVTIGCNLNVGNTSTCTSITITGASVGGFTAGYIGWGAGNQVTPGLYINSPGTNLEITTGFNERVALSTGTGLQVYTNNGVGTYTSRLLIDRNGVSCFNSAVCSPAFIGGTVSGTTGTFSGQICTPSSLVLGTNNAYALYLRDSTGTAKPVMATAGGTNLNLYNVCNTGAIIINNATDTGAIVKIDNIGIGCFAGIVCSAGLRTTDSIALLKNAASDNRYIQFCDTNTGGYRYDFILQSTAQGCGFGLYNNNTAAWGWYLTPNGNLGINTTSPSYPLTRNGITVKAATNDGTEFVMLSCADTEFSGGALVRNGTDFGVINRTAGCLIFATNATERMWINSSGIACFACELTAKTVCASSMRIASTAINSGNITLSGYPTSICFGNGQTLNDNGGGGLTILSGAAIGLTAGSCVFINCTTNFGKYQKSTNGNWYKIPFSVTKNVNTGTAATFCIVNIISQDSFNELVVFIDYGARLQNVSDSYTRTSSRMYGVNRFSGATPTIGDVYITAGGSGCGIDTHAPVTTAISGTCILVKVDFSTTPSYSSFVFGEIRIYSIENLNSSLTIPYNEW